MKTTTKEERKGRFTYVVDANNGAGSDFSNKHYQQSAEVGSQTSLMVKSYEEGNLSSETSSLAESSSSYSIADQ